MRKAEYFKIDDLAHFKQKSLTWAGNFSHFSYLNSNNFKYLYSPFPELLAIGAREVISFSHDPFDTLKDYFEKHHDWLFGYFGYDLKNKIENLSSNNHDRLQLPEIYFYKPLYLLTFHDNAVKIESFEDPDQVYKDINNTGITTASVISSPSFRLNMVFDEYKQKVNKIRNHILEGDIYEMNFCLEFFAEDCEIDPLSIYQKLNENSPMPFSTFTRLGQHYLLNASPERFLKKSGNKLISQPIKGTIRRGNNAKEDQLLKDKLRNDEKEIAENLMIVDLVRNDMAKSSIAGSVKVEELFSIYTFPQVHQMISTITSEVKTGIHFTEVIRNAFPMGSMTGAPKIKVMELIEKYENSKRSLYSGAFGFITPAGDFDFNVVIRSLIYDSQSKQLSFMAGSAITYDSDPDQEFQECLLKAKAIGEIFNKKILS